MPNRLSETTSPYLLQHAHNPVDWYPWGQEALEKAKREDRPILISIGYSSCHWCHVMERESFENKSIADLMNKQFVCIKVDREERPDIDQIYMDAVQAMKINGGWPLNVFLTPDQKPFYGGTYFPRDRWATTLTQLSKAFHNRRKEIEEAADDLTRHVAISDTHRLVSLPEKSLEINHLESLFTILKSRFDSIYGGIDKAPKFVMPSVWQWLLMYHPLNLKVNGQEMVDLTLTRMSDGGLYDQIQGGFARYSVDGEWFAPHFEKMLYDNGQLLGLYANGWRLLKKKRYLEILRETLAWLKKEMTHPNGGIYSALDADSEGIEGRYYVWTYAEWQQALGNNSSLLGDFYSIASDGNWEHGFSILKRPDNYHQFLSQHKITEEAFEAKLMDSKKLLLSIRNRRLRPGLDDKIITAWNAMTITGLAEAFLATGEDDFLKYALKAIEFLENQLILKDRVLRTYKNHSNPTEGFLEDYAFVIQSYVTLYQTTFHENHLLMAERITKIALTQFYDPEDGYFFYTSHRAEKLIARKKEIFDNVIPSSNSIMAGNLLVLGTLLQNPEWMLYSKQMTEGLSKLILEEPVYLSQWAQVYTQLATGLTEIVIVGPDYLAYRHALGSYHLPFSVFCGTKDKSSLPLLVERESTDERTRIYVCKNNTCQLPVYSVEKALELIGPPAPESLSYSVEN